MEEYDKRVTAMYNDCWKLYRDYTKSHDMRQFNEAKDAVIKKYDRQCDFLSCLQKWKTDYDPAFLCRKKRFSIFKITIMSSKRMR